MHKKLYTQSGLEYVGEVSLSYETDSFNELSFCTNVGQIAYYNLLDEEGYQLYDDEGYEAVEYIDHHE